MNNQPSQTYLDAYEVELTGEYRIPVLGDKIPDYDRINGSIREQHSPWTLNEIKVPDCLYQGPRWILRKKELPPKPSQAWLDEHSVELTGECRKPKDGELVASWNSWSSHPAYPFKWEKENSKFIDKTGPGSMRWILQKKSTPAPALVLVGEKLCLVCGVLSKGLIEYYRQPGNGLTSNRTPNVEQGS